MDDVVAERDELRARLAEAESILDAIRGGEVDALVVSEGGGEQVFTLHDADHYYRILIEEMGEGALILTAEGLIYYANRRLAAMLKTPLDGLIGSELARWIGPDDRPAYLDLLASAQPHPQRHLEMALLTADAAELPCQLAFAAMPIAEMQGAFCLVATDLSEQKRAAARVVAAEKLARAILEQAAEAIVVCDRDGRIIRASDVAQSLCLRSPVGESFDQVFSLLQADRRPLSLMASTQQGRRRLLEASLDCNGRERNLLVSVGPLRATAGDLLGSVVTLTDITRRRQAEDALRQSEQRMKSIVENLPVGVWFVDAAGRIDFGNPAAQQIWAGAHYVGPEHYGDYKAWRLGSRKPLAADEWGAARAISYGETVLDEELEIECFDGTRKIILNSAVPIRDRDGSVIGAIVLNQDITERKAAEGQIEQLAFYDHLTQLPNRRLLRDRLEQTLAAVARSGQQGALLFIDLDNFKDLNDSLGHDIGDLLLQQVAQRLTVSVRARDTVARLGGDEFVVVLADLSDQAEEAATRAQQVGKKILAALGQPYRLAEQIHHSTPSIGATLIHAEGIAVDELLRRADLAMYQAKAAGRNTLRFFDPDMQAALEARTVLEAQMREGLRQGHFQLYYQPQVDSTGALIGAEALLRWRHPERGLVAPGEFIALAEETGLILPLGYWVLDAACAQLAAWSGQPGAAGLSLSVNVSPRQFRDPDFEREVQRVLARHAIDPRYLQLEITESLLLDDMEDCIAKMTALQALGLRFSMDDFGTGYSSLAYLKRLPLDHLKIDQSFVRDVLTDPNDAAIVRAILALAPELGLTAIAEGVETEGQRQFLLANGCPGFQGYLFGRPGPVEALFAGGG